MKFSATTTALAALAASQVAVASQHPHAVKHNHAARHVEYLKSRSEEKHIGKRDLASILTAGIKSVGLNKEIQTDAATAWIGNDGKFVNEVFNEGTEDLIFVVWGPWASWVNVQQPQITVSVPAGHSVNISLPIGMSGAYAALYPDTKLVNGQISETWGEFTIAPPYTTIDVSREVNMKGRNMAIVTPQCTSSMTKCVFVCPDGQDTCMYGYELKNCDVASQLGANKGVDPNLNFAASGGCSGMGDAAHIKTYLNYAADKEATF